MASTVLVGAVAVAWQLPYFDRWMSLLDEGHIMAYADLLAKGGEMYRDATSLALPGAFYLLALGFAAVEPSVLLARWMVVLEFSVLCMVAFALLRRLGPSHLAWLGVVGLLVYRIWAFPQWQMYSYSTTALTVLAGALYFAVRFLESGRRWALMLAGLLTGLGILCKQDYGASAFLAFNVVVAIAVLTQPARTRPSPLNLLACFNVPVAFVGLATGLHYLRQGVLPDLIEQTVRNPLFAIAETAYWARPAPFPLFEQDPALRGPTGLLLYVPSILATVDWERISASWLYRETFVLDLAIKLYYYAPYATAALAAASIWCRRSDLFDANARSAYLAELALVVYAAFLLASLIHPVDYSHITVLCWPLICLLVLHVVRRARFWRRRMVALTAGILVACLVAYSGFLGWRLRSIFSQPLGEGRGGISVEPSDARVIGATVDYVREHSEPGEAVAVLPYFPLISFLADRPAPHRSAWLLWPVQYYPERGQDVVASIEARRSPLVLYHFTQTVHYPPMREFAPDVFGYLVDQYEIDRVFSESGLGHIFGALGRSEEQARGRRILDSRAANASVRIEHQGTTRRVPAEERARFLRSDVWPFRPVFSLRPSAHGARTVLSVAVEVEPGDRLRTAIAVHPDLWFDYPQSAVTFTVRTAEQRGGELLYRRTLDPQRLVEDRGWFEIDLALEPRGEGPLELEFATEVDRARGSVFEMAGWEVPRVVSRGK